MWLCMVVFLVFLLWLMVHFVCLSSGVYFFFFKQKTAYDLRISDGVQTCALPILLASERSAGEKLEYGAKTIVVQDLATFDPAGIDIALFSAGGSVSKEYAPKFAAAGAVVIDNSSVFRQDDDVPLVVAEVNPDAARDRPRGIIANPNCSTMQLLVALAPIHRAAKIERINIATYQSVSGTGKRALEELGRQTAGLLSFQQAQPEV